MGMSRSLRTWCRTPCLSPQKQLSETPGNSFCPASDQYLLVVISTEADNNLDTIFKKNLVEHYYNLRQLNSRRPAEEDVGKDAHERLAKLATL